MPDRADVEQSLAELVATLLYPNGYDLDSITGDPYRVYRGWPAAGVLERDLAKGVCHVSILSIAGSRRDTSRYGAEWQGASPAATLTAEVAGQVVSFDGVGGGGQVAGLRVDGHCYAYRTRDGDSSALVAAALAAQIRPNRPAVNNGSDIYLMNARDLIARVAVDGQGGRELRRQVSGFRVTFWCPTASLRDQVVGQVDVALADVTFLNVDGWSCRLRASSDDSSDRESAGGLWRRDLVYSIEYPTVISENLPAMLFGIADVNSIPFVG